METLFIDQDGKSYDAKMVRDILISAGAGECDNLFVHSDIIFGTTPADFNRKEYMEILFSIFQDIGVKNIIVPTFTYSFCNNEVYDVNKSRTSMGALNEFFRKNENRYRTLDPLLSVSVPNTLKSKFANPSSHSLGEGSALDTVHHLPNTKFLFFGIPMGVCFTYLHYVEKMLDVPYRFDMKFSGDIVGYNGEILKERTQSIHTACYGVRPKDFYHFEDYLEDKRIMKKVRLGDKFIECIREEDAYSEIVNMIQRDINYFLEKPFTEKDLLHKYTKGINGERITHC